MTQNSSGKKRKPTPGKIVKFHQDLTTGNISVIDSGDGEHHVDHILPARRTAPLSPDEQWLTDVLKKSGRRAKAPRPKTVKARPIAKKKKAKVVARNSKSRSFSRRKRAQSLFIQRWRLAQPELPGAVMLKIAETLFTREKVNNVYKPIIADYQHETQAARREGGLKPLIAKIEHWSGFLKACGMGAVLELAGKIWKLLS